MTKNYFYFKFLGFVFAIILGLFYFSPKAFAQSCDPYSGAGGGYYCHGGTNCTWPDGNSSGYVTCAGTICGTPEANFQCDTSGQGSFGGPPYFSTCHINCGSSSGGAARYAVGGKVIDESNGNGVAGVLVKIELYEGNSTNLRNPREVYTDSSGDFLFEDAAYVGGISGDYKYKLSISKGAAGYTDYAYIVDWRYGRNSTWNADIPKAMRVNGWNGGYSKVGMTSYEFQDPPSGCHKDGDGWGATGAPANRCWFSLRPAPYNDISGSIKDSETGTGIGGVTVSITNLSTNANPLNVITDSSGNYVAGNYIHTGDKYSVEVIGVPSGYDDNVTAIDWDYDFTNNSVPAPIYAIGYTWNSNANRDTYTNESIYDNQISGSSDCASASGGNPAGRCSFVANKLTIVGGQVVDSATRNGVSNVRMLVTNVTKGNSITVSTNSSGVFTSSTYPRFIALGDKYNIQIASNGFSTTQYMSGTTYNWQYTSTSPIVLGSAIGWTWSYSAVPNRDTLVGESGYFGQVANNINDCSSQVGSVSNRCWFVLNRVLNARVSVDVVMDYTVNGGTSPYVVSKLQDDTYMDLRVANGGSTGVYTSMSPVGTSVFTQTGGNCIAAYADNIHAPQCNNFFNSQNIDRGIAAVRLYSPGGMFTCQWQNPTLGANAPWETLPLVAFGSQYYCQTPDFTVIDNPTNTLNANSKWPTNLKIKVKYVKGQIVSNVFKRTYTPGNNVAGQGRFTINTQLEYKPVFAGGKTSTILRQSPLYYWFDRANWQYPNYTDTSYIAPAYTRDGWATGATVVASLTSPRTTDACYYKFSRTVDGAGFNNSTNLVDQISKISLTEINPSVSPGNYQSLLNSMTYSANCSNMRTNLTNDNFAPGYETALDVLVAPKITMQPYIINLVSGPDQCGNTGTNITSSSNPRFNLYDNGTQVLTQAASSSLSAYSMVFPRNYQVVLASVTINGQVFSNADLGKLGFCSPDGSSGINRDEIDLQTLMPTYPDIPDADATIDRSFTVYIKDSNNWWQVYNGGIHSNLSSISVDSFSRPPTAVLVGDPSAATPVLPNRFNLTSFNTGGLVSYADINPSNYSQFGIDSRDWSVRQNNDSNGVKSLNIADVIKKATASGSNWRNVTNAADALTNRYSYMKGSSFNITNQFNNYNTSTNKVVMLMDSSNGSNTKLTIGSNITRANGSGILFIVVNGSVEVAPSVTQIDAVIYTTKTFTVKSAGNDLDVSNLIRGALYTQDGYGFGRDLPNSGSFLDTPSQQILYQPEIFTKKGGTGTEFPPELLESNVYWAVE
ncbi:MAG: carboxypeptidase regulatory-like domain-containing protein [Niabella sp.]|nr:MAG: carboxypeptidase regulatory-like domain-containing protein [Niabella sp.]